jgi:hypothetical protein
MVSVNTVAPAATDALDDTRGEVMEAVESVEAVDSVDPFDGVGEGDAVFASPTISTVEPVEAADAESEATKRSVLCSRVAAPITPFASS